MVLFATDIAARGLDFPTVDWVVQVDCPEDVAAYIHRCGRLSGRGCATAVPPAFFACICLTQPCQVPLIDVVWCMHGISFLLGVSAPCPVSLIGNSSLSLSSDDSSLLFGSLSSFVAYTLTDDRCGLHGLFV